MLLIGICKYGVVEKMFDIGERFIDRLDVFCEVIFELFEPCRGAFEILIQPLFFAERS